MDHVTGTFYHDTKAVYTHDDFGNLIQLPYTGDSFLCLIFFFVDGAKDWYMQ